MMNKRKLLLITIICSVFLISFIILYSNFKKNNETSNHEINLLWEKFDVELNSLGSKNDLLNNKKFSYESLTQLQTFINRYYNTRNDSDTYTESIYNYKSKKSISKKEIKKLNRLGLYFDNYYSNFYQDINNYKELMLNNTDKNFVILNNYFNLFTNYYDLKVMNNSNCFSDILENEIILLQYVNLMADLLIESLHLVS